jgi:prolyl oligopeptidase
MLDRPARCWAPSLTPTGDASESDVDLLVEVQNPLNPARLLLTSVTSAPLITLKCVPKAFNAEGLVVTRHEAVSTDGERIPQGETGDVPVYMTAYGGFNSFIKPYNYRPAIGKIWLERALRRRKRWPILTTCANETNLQKY